MLPNLDNLSGLEGLEFEAERNRIISGYIKSLPPERRAAAYLMQLNIDKARMTLSDEEFLKWMQNEAQELTANIDDLFLNIKHKFDDINRVLSRPQS